MKRYAILPLMAAALAGCAKFAPETVETVPSDEKTPFVIYVGLPGEDGATKTSFNESDYTVSWTKGDELAVTIDGNLYKFVKVEGEDNAFNCSDFHPVDGETYEYDILYPYSADGKFTMSGGVKTPMHGIGKATGKDSPNVRLDQLTALIKVTVKNENALGTATLTSISVERADGGILGGKHKLESSAVVPVEGETVSSTTVGSQNKKIAAGAGVDMYLQCAPFTAEEDMKLLVKYTVDGVEYVSEKTLSKGVLFKAGTVNKTSVSFAAPDAIFIDFGSKSTTGWNNITDINAANIELLDTKSESTGITLTLSGNWKLYNPVGSEPELYVEYENSQYPKSAWCDSFLLQSNPGSVMFTGMSTDAVYKFTIASYRWNGTPSVRKTRFELSGIEDFGSKDINQGTRDNKMSDVESHFAVFENVRSDSEGCVTLTVTPITIGNLCEGHLSAIKIERIR